VGGLGPWDPPKSGPDTQTAQSEIRSCDLAHGTAYLQAMEYGLMKNAESFW